MILSVIALVSDGYEEYVADWIENVKAAIQIEKEIIIVDNTTNQSIPDQENIKIVKMDHNAQQFAGRRCGVAAASGEYIFLTDIDDVVLSIKEFKWDEELICFNYVAGTKEDEKTYLCDAAYPISYTASKTFFFNNSWKTAIKNMVWNKFYKKELLERVYAKLPAGLEFSFMEDTLLNILVLAEVQSIRFETSAYYKYYFGTGVSTKTLYTEIKHLESLVSGIDVALGIFNMSVPEELQKQSGITFENIYQGIGFYLLKKYEVISNDILEDYTKLISKYFEKNILLYILKNSKIDRKVMLKAKHCINDYL